MFNVYLRLIGKGIGIKNFTLLVFDRWGEKIFTTTDINKGCDGTVKGKDTEDKIDVYQWKVYLTDLRGKEYNFVGHVSLIK